MTMSSVSSWVSWTVEASAKVTTWPQMERSHGRGAAAGAPLRRLTLSRPCTCQRCEGLDNDARAAVRSAR